MARILLWFYKKMHLYDDYSVRATKYDDIRENIYTYSTPWFLQAVVRYIRLHFVYPDCTIVFTHFKYR